jgi:predicted nucleic acid-binding protein
MNDRAFFDSNLLVYFVTDTPQKGVIDGLILNTPNRFISLQCLNEFSNVYIKKKYLSTEALSEALYHIFELFTIHYTTKETVIEALQIKQRYGYSYYDSLIIATSLDCDCNILYSEDMQDGQIINSRLIISNPIK